MNISVLGDGGWGSAVACHLAKLEHNVTLWGPFEENIDFLKKNFTNPKFLPGISFPGNLKFSAQLDSSVEIAEIIVLALPTEFVRNLLIKLRPLLNHDRHIILNLSKGIENNSLKRISQITEEILGSKANYNVLSGPSHAEEVAKEVPTAVVIGSKNSQTSVKVQDAFISDTFRVYCSDDVTGVELGGSLKNVYAIAAGIADGMGLGDNTKAALMTRSIAELSRLGKALGGQFETFSGLSGIGDLIVTCCSKHSRNRHVGEKLGEGMSLDEIRNSMGMMVAEGIKTSKSSFELSKLNNVETPIIDEVYSVIYNGKDPKKCITDLMTRTPKHELY